MTRPARGLLHTSVFIAAESGRPLDEQLMPDETVISEIRARRMATLDAVADVELIGIDESRPSCGRGCGFISSTPVGG